MSANYAAGLSFYSDKGKLGLPEHFMSLSEVASHVSTLAEMLRSKRHVVVHTGAGISTSAGIPDFRGPKGIWTLEEKGVNNDCGLDWLQARPTFTHLALKRLIDENLVQFVVSQNIDGLHMRSGLIRSKLAELHGNMFVDKCDTCHRMRIRGSPSMTVGQKSSKTNCVFKRNRGRRCRGHLADFVLDWEHELPQNDLDLSISHSNKADLNIVLGSTLQIVPSGNLPTAPLRGNVDAKLVIVNLQRTKHHNKAHLVIHDYVDNVMKLLMEKLGLTVPEYDANNDPVVRVSQNSEEIVEWTQTDEETHRVYALWMEEKKRRAANRKRKNGLAIDKFEGEASEGSYCKDVKLSDYGESGRENDDSLGEFKHKKRDHSDNSDQGVNCTISETVLNRDVFLHPKELNEEGTNLHNNVS